MSNTRMFYVYVTSFVVCLVCVGICDEPALDIRRGTDGRAVASAWKDMTTSSDGKRDVSRFFGFIEGRLGVKPPKWWERLLSGINYSDDIHFTIPLDSNWLYEPPSNGIKVARDQKVKVVDGGFAVQNGTQQMIVSKAILDMSGKYGQINTIDTETDNDHAFIAVRRFDRLEYCVFRIDSHSGEIQWQADVLVGATLTNSSGREYHFIELVHFGHNVYVFGISDRYVYIRGYDSLSGEHRLAFTATSSGDIIGEFPHPEDLGGSGGTPE